MPNGLKKKRMAFVKTVILKFESCQMALKERTFTELPKQTCTLCKYDLKRTILLY